MSIQTPEAIEKSISHQVAEYGHLLQDAPAWDHRDLDLVPKKVCSECWMINNFCFC